jgi:hypothetical protein
MALAHAGEEGGAEGLVVVARDMMHAVIVSLLPALHSPEASPVISPGNPSAFLKLHFQRLQNFITAVDDLVN